MNTTNDYGESDFPSCDNCESIGQYCSKLGKSFSSTCMKIDFLSQSTNNMQQCLAKCYDCMQECEEESRKSVMDSKCGVGIGAACAATTVDNYSYMPKCCVCNMPTCQCDLMGLSIPQTSVNSNPPAAEYMSQQQFQPEEQDEEEEEEQQLLLAQPSKNTCLLAKQNGKSNDQCLLVKQCKLVKGKAKGKKAKGKSKKKHDCNEFKKMLRDHEKALNGDDGPIKCYKDDNEDNNNDAMDVEKDSENACQYLKKFNNQRKQQKPVCLLTRNPYKIQKPQVKKKNPLTTMQFTGSSAPRRQKQCTCGLFPCKCCFANSWSLPKLQCLDPTTTPSAFMDGCHPELACVPNTYASFATPELLNWKSPFLSNMSCQPQGNQDNKFQCLSHGSRETERQTEDNSQISECLKAFAQACAAQNDDDMDDNWEDNE